MSLCYSSKRCAPTLQYWRKRCATLVPQHAGAGEPRPGRVERWGIRSRVRTLRVSACKMHERCGKCTCSALASQPVRVHVCVWSCRTCSMQGTPLAPAFQAQILPALCTIAWQCTKAPRCSGIPSAVQTTPCRKTYMDITLYTPYSPRRIHQDMPLMHQCRCFPDFPTQNAMLRAAQQL